MADAAKNCERELAEALIEALGNQGSIIVYSSFEQTRINHDDEGEFKAKFEATDGKLGLLVDFHKKGMFPPGAY